MHEPPERCCTEAPHHRYTNYFMADSRSELWCPECHTSTGWHSTLDETREHWKRLMEQRRARKYAGEVS